MMHRGCWKKAGEADKLMVQGHMRNCPDMIFDLSSSPCHKSSVVWSIKPVKKNRRRAGQ